MTTQQRIDKITEELRDIYLNTNEGPRLIAEMVEREFPHPRKVWNDNPDKDRAIKGGWGMAVTDRGRG